MKTYFLLPLLLFGLLQPVTAQCPMPLPDRIVDSLYIDTPYSTLELAPGSSVDVGLGALQPDADQFDLEQCVTWRVDGRGLVRIDPGTGFVTVDDAAPDGWTFVVIADVEQGRTVLALAGLVYDPMENPLVGAWREDARFDCATGRQVRGSSGIGELVFRADGTFYVTRRPFEIYHDYQGRYVADPSSRRISFRQTSGNVIPERIDGFGRYEIDERGRLVLDGVSFGRFPEDRKRACRYIFVH